MRAHRSEYSGRPSVPAKDTVDNVDLGQISKAIAKHDVSLHAPFTHALPNLSAVQERNGTHFK